MPAARELELARVTAAYRDAAAGSGRLVLLTGEAGIGKTWLAQAAAEIARSRGMHVARGWCLDDPAGPPLWMWRRVARDVPELRTTVQAFRRPDLDLEARLDLSDQAAHQLASAAGASGLLVVLEDLQWADDLSLDLLRHLLLELVTMPVLVVATARDEAAEGTPFGSALSGLVHAPNVTHLALGGLDEDQVRHWLACDPQTARWAARAAELVRLTGGNPFYVGSLLSELLGTPEADVEVALGRRPMWRSVLVAPLRTLPAPAAHSLTVAAVLGERLSPALVAAAVDRPIEEVSGHLAAGVRAGLLSFGETGLAFRHALVRDAIIASMAPAQLEAAHAGAARALEETGDPLLTGPAAFHWSHVTGPEAARRCRDLASVAATAQTFAPDRGVELACLAVESARELGAGPEEMAELLLLFARLQWAAGRLHPALATCATGLDLSEAANRPDLLADFALVPQGVGDPEVGLRVGAMSRRALAALPASEVVRRARILALSAVAAAELRQPNLAPGISTEPLGADELDPDAASAEALEVARKSGEPQAELETIAARHYVLSYPQSMTERAALAARAVVLGPRATTSMGALWGHLWEADLAFQRGDAHDVRRVTAAVDDVARARSSPIAEWHVLRLRAALDVLEGRFDAARATAGQARRIADRVGDLSMIGMHVAFSVSLAHLRGDPGEVLPDWSEVLRRAPPMPLVRISVVIVRALEGDLDGARSALEPFRGLAERFPLGPRWLGTVGQIGFAAVLVGDTDLARTCYRLLLPCAPWCPGDGGGSPFAGGSSELALGDLARTVGDLPLAARHYERAVTVNDRTGASPYAALARLGLAECLPDPIPALALVRSSAQEFRRLDMPGPSARAAALTRRLDRAVGGTTARADGLTEREVEVSGLVGQALTNQQIADRLFLSVRTVESHVRSILAKLGLSSRTEIAVWVRDRG